MYMNIARSVYSGMFTTRLNKYSKFMEAIPRLIILVQLLTALTIASAIGSLHYYYKEADKV
jgi:hypothetical protein